MRRLDSLKALQVAEQLALNAYRLTLEPGLKTHFGLSDQIRRAAGSVPANIVEGYGLGTRAQFRRGTRIAYASARELRIHLNLL